MTTRPDMPDLPAKQQVEKIEKKIDAEQTRSVFINTIGLLLVVHFLLTLAITGEGVAGYLLSWRRIVLYVLHNPVAGAVIPLALWGLYRGIDMWRHPDPDEIHLPAFEEIRDLRWENAIYVGSGHTRDGKQPGEVMERNDEVMDEEHVVLTEKGLFGNIHVKGGVGSGKTSTFIMPFLDQAIAKFPDPPAPDEFPLNPDGRYGMNGGDREDGRGMGEKLLDAMRVQDETERYDNLPYQDRWNPYLGMTPDQAEEAYRKMREDHEKNRWGLFAIDPKGDLTEYVQRSAKMSGREDDVIVLQPGGEHTYNPLAISHNPLVQAEMVMDGIEAVSGEGVPAYWRSTQSEWLANALEILRVVEPTRVNFEAILKMARNETQRVRWVAEAEAIMQQAREEEERLRRVGKDYDGIRVNPAAIEFFRDWDDEDTDPKQKRAVVSGIKSQAKFFVDAEIAPFLCPKMPPTFPGFDEMINNGKIVVLRMPLSEYGPVAKVLGILMLADAQQAARERITRPDWNQERVVAFVVDEISAYLNRLTKDFVAMNRQSRVTFLAAHQSQGQLIQHHDRGYEQSFNDNLRTKISYSAPNADAATKEVRIYGARKVFKEVWSEGTTFGDVEREAGSESIKPGRESQGATRRVEEVHRSWFEAEDFMALELGECIVMPFDGEATRPPRKIRAPRYWLMERNQIAAGLDLDDPLPAPHPVVRIEEPGRRFQYFVSALNHSGYTIVEPLADADGHLAGFRFVTSIGTLIVPVHVLDEMRELVVERLGDPQKLIALTQLRAAAVFLEDMLGVVFERVVDLPGAYRRLADDAPEGDFYDLAEAVTGHTFSYPRRGAWEYHWGDFGRHAAAILEGSLAMTDFFRVVGRHFHDMPADEVEGLYGRTLEAMEALLSEGGGDPTAIAGPPASPADDPGGPGVGVGAPPPAPSQNPDPSGVTEGGRTSDETAADHSASVVRDSSDTDTPPPPDAFGAFEPPEMEFEAPGRPDLAGPEEPSEEELEASEIPGFDPVEGTGGGGYGPFDGAEEDPFASPTFPDEPAGKEPVIEALPAEDALAGEDAVGADPYGPVASGTESDPPEDETNGEEVFDGLRFSEETLFLPGFAETYITSSETDEVPAETSSGPAPGPERTEEGTGDPGKPPGDSVRDLRFPEIAPASGAPPPEPGVSSRQPPSSTPHPDPDDPASRPTDMPAGTDPDQPTPGSGGAPGDRDAGPAGSPADVDDACKDGDDGSGSDAGSRRSRGGRRSARDLDDTDFADGAPER